MFLEREQRNEQTNTEKTLIVHCHERFSQHQFDEFVSLAHTSGVDLVDTFVRTLRQEHPTTYLTSGLLDELATQVVALKNTHQITLILVNTQLRPAQERALERTLGCRIIDRTGLILDVFARHAQSDIGKLQVELAQLQFFATRLKRAWTHLERQKGGIGLRGPGESQLATDKHLIRQRTSLLQRKLNKLQQQRQQNRKRAIHNRIPRITLVGYTNTGKSTLHHALTKTQLQAEDKLFATLDSLSRTMLIDKQKYIVTDTVGFIDNLPHQLIASFAATLDDVRTADLLVHVVDISSEMMGRHMQVVKDTLAYIGVADTPIITVYNKCDLRTHNTQQDALASGLFLSASKATNVDRLKAQIVQTLHAPNITTEWHLTNHNPAHHKLKHKIYTAAAKIEEFYDHTGMSMLKCQMSAVDYARLQAYAHTHCTSILTKSTKA